MELHDGDIIIFKDIINYSFLDSSTYNIIFSSSGYSYNFIGMRIIDNTLRFIRSDTGGLAQATYNTGEWLLPSYKTIIIIGNQTISDESFVNWLYENTVSGLPPRVMENMYSVVSSQIEYSFTNIGNVVGTIVNNGVLTIFTLGIFIISLAVGILRRLSRRKSFKK